MRDWYSRQEVADLLGISKNTVYHYAKRGKIVKIEDPHRSRREVSYRKEEVEQLLEERRQQQITGMRPTELARQMNISVHRIYQIINEHQLPIDEVQIGDERKGYSISQEMADRIREIAKEVLPERGTRTEFFNNEHDIALFQLFKGQGHEIRVIRNDDWIWGFHINGSWVPYEIAVKNYGYTPVYRIHQKNMTVQGYTDFKLPKHMQQSYQMLDFVYQIWGIENVRIRELDDHINLSVKAGTVELQRDIPEALTDEVLTSFLVQGEYIHDYSEWTMISSYKKYTIELPQKLIEQVQQKSTKQKITPSEFIQRLLEERLGKE